jgi:hypothetical protein
MIEIFNLKYLKLNRYKVNEIESIESIQFEFSQIE